MQYTDNIELIYFNPDDESTTRVDTYRRSTSQNFQRIDDEFGDVSKSIDNLNNELKRVDTVEGDIDKLKTNSFYLCSAHETTELEDGTRVPKVYDPNLYTTYLVRVSSSVPNNYAAYFYNESSGEYELINSQVRNTYWIDKEISFFGQSAYFYNTVDDTDDNFANSIKKKLNLTAYCYGGNTFLDCVAAAMDSSRFRNDSLNVFICDPVGEWWRDNLPIGDLRDEVYYDGSGVYSYSDALYAIAHYASIGAPSSELLFVTFPPAGEEYTGANANGVILEDYANQTIKFAQKHGFAVCDLYHALGGNNKTVLNSIFTDGLLNDIGRARFADMLINAIESHGIGMSASPVVDITGYATNDYVDKAVDDLAGIIDDTYVPIIQEHGNIGSFLAINDNNKVVPFDKFVNDVFKDKYPIFFGTSITQYCSYNTFDPAHVYTETGYPKLVADHFGMTFDYRYNIYAKAGSTMAYPSDAEHYDIFGSIYDEITKNKSAIKAADFVFIECGTNDFKKDVSLGSESDKNVNTFCGALNLAITEIQDANPLAIIVLLSPTQRGADENGKYYSTYENKAYCTLETYVGAMRNIANQRGVLFCDWFTDREIKQGNISEYTWDGYLHLDEDGYRVVADLTIQLLRENGYKYLKIPSKVSDLKNDKQYITPTTSYAMTFEDNVNTNSYVYVNGGLKIRSNASVADGCKLTVYGSLVAPSVTNSDGVVITCPNAEKRISDIEDALSGLSDLLDVINGEVVE